MFEGLLQTLLQVSAEVSIVTVKTQPSSAVGLGEGYKVRAVNINRQAFARVTPFFFAANFAITAVVKQHYRQRQTCLNSYG